MPRTSMPRTSAQHAHRDVNAAARAEQALTLRKAGYGYQVIAKQCGYASRGAAYTAVQRELARTIQQPADDVRKLELERLNDLFIPLYAKALKGDTWSTDRCLKIMERRAALLGLDMDKGQGNAAQMVIVGVPQSVMDAV